MRAVIGLVVVVAVVTVAGCGPAVFESASEARGSAMLPAGIGLAAAADTEYQFEASVGYASTEYETLTADDGWMATVGFSWYFMGAVQNDDVAIELQPVAQMASDVTLDVAFGTIEFPFGDEDESAWSIGAKYVHKEGGARGLGGEVSIVLGTVEDYYGPGDDRDTTTWRVGALYYIPKVTTETQGLIATLGYSNEGFDAPAGDFDIGGIDLGARYYVRVAEGQWIDAAVTYDFHEAESSGGYSEDIGRFGIGVDYYPLKFLGFGVSYSSEDWKDTTDEDFSTFGIGVVWNVEQVPGLDLNINWEKKTYDSAPGAFSDDTTFSVRIDYRF